MLCVYRAFFVKAHCQIQKHATSTFFILLNFQVLSTNLTLLCLSRLVISLLKKRYCSCLLGKLDFFGSVVSYSWVGLKKISCYWFFTGLGSVVSAWASNITRVGRGRGASTMYATLSSYKNSSWRIPLQNNKNWIGIQQNMLTWLFLM